MFYFSVNILHMQPGQSEKNMRKGEKERKQTMEATQIFPLSPRYHLILNLSSIHQLSPPHPSYLAQDSISYSASKGFHCQWPNSPTPFISQATSFSQKLQDLTFISHNTFPFFLLFTYKVSPLEQRTSFPSHYFVPLSLNRSSPHLHVDGALILCSAAMVFIFLYEKVI